MFKTSRDFAKFCGLPIKYVRRLCREGKLSHIDVGSTHFVYVDEAMDQLEMMAKPGKSVGKSYKDIISEMRQGQKEHGYPLK